MFSLNFKKIAVLACAGSFLFAMHPEAALTEPKEPMRGDVKHSFQSGNEVSEADMLSGLDKIGRAMYQSLDEENKLLARHLAAESKDLSGEEKEQAYKSAVKEALKHMAKERLETQERRLHNGMDRLKGMAHPQ